MENPPKVLQDLSEPDASSMEEKNDLGAGSDVGCAALTETPALAPGESSLGAAEERFHVRSVNEALSCGHAHARGLGSGERGEGSWFITVGGVIRVTKA